MLEVLKSRISAWKRYQRVVSQLNALSNRDLSDIGIGRSDIEEVAKRAIR